MAYKIVHLKWSMGHYRMEFQVELKYYLTFENKTTRMQSGIYISITIIHMYIM